MKRYSIAPSSSRRKSTINPNLNLKGDDNIDGESATLELERLEQEITLVLQEIDKNLSKSNAVINDKIFPILKKYAGSSSNVWNNVNFWKYFLEQAANVELTSYEAPANMNTDLNTIANSKNNFLILDDEEAEDGENAVPEHREGASEGAEPIQQFKKPMLKGFNTVEETPTWSTGEQNAPPHQYNMQASTPQLKQRSSFIHNQKPNLGKTTNDRLQSTHTLAPTLSSEEQSSMNTKSPQKLASPPVVTHTIRQSLDNYHKISISPRKPQRSIHRTPLREGSMSEDVRRRSSLIQNLIDSSPTLPEPPVLLSERGYLNSGSNSNGENGSKESSESKDLGRLSPILLPPKSTPGRQNRRSDSENTMQRFPRTPNFTPSGSREDGAGVDIMRTPLGVRIRYGEDDSDLPPPELQNVPSVNDRSNNDDNNLGTRNEVDEDEVPLPDLETIELPNSNKKRRLSNTRKHDDKKRQSILPGDDDEQNVFLDNTSNKQNNSAHTIYHSMINNQDTLQNQSKDNTANQSKNSNQSNSRSISYLFEEVLYNTKINNKGDTNNPDNQPNSQARNLFDSFNDQAKQNEVAANDTSDQTGNSTSELGSLLGERFKNFTNYTQSMGQ